MKRESIEKEEAKRKSACVVAASLEHIQCAAHYMMYSIQNTDKGFVMEEGIAEMDSATVIEMHEGRQIEADVRAHKLVRVDDEVMSAVEHKRVLDLNDDGERWEGDVLEDQPYGWGVLFDSEGEKAYEGFRIGDMNVCYGARYYSDIQKIEYEGEWCEGKRWGKGVQYDRNGNTVFEGEWLNDDHNIEKRVVVTNESEKKLVLHNRVEELIVCDDCCNGKEWRVLDVSLLPSLRSLQVGDNCFENVEEVKLIGLNALEKVAVGRKSFTKEKNSFGNDPKRHFYLKDCERLEELKIGRFSFSDFTVCEIEKADRLQTIQMGDVHEWSYNFNYASLVLKSVCWREAVMNRLPEAAVPCVWRLRLPALSLRRVRE